jgi:hypothetical protein
LSADIDNNQKLSLWNNLKNKMQKAEKIILFLTLKKAPYRIHK